MNALTYLIAFMPTTMGWPAISPLAVCVCLGAFGWSTTTLGIFGSSFDGVRHSRRLPGAQDRRT